MYSNGGFIEYDENNRARINNPYIKFLWKLLQGYNHEKYWKMRQIVVNSDLEINLLIKLWYLFRIKRIDKRNHSSFGTDLNKGAKFETPPYLPHGPNGIIIGLDTVVGKNVTIFHHVTIMHGNVVIGDNVLLGAGSKVLPNVIIGHNVKVGANCVVVEDAPDNSTVVLHKPRIIKRG